ncbi:hypothetical protein AQUCO_02000193v1 [Aquilegia coerulea]|uniref:3-hydroxyisobutyryl-CoA hydrolase n=1 Tax=Aquilegia coerulea TaxID=218851 RepID=A0A2G5DGH6_AQUCA|nr:hypothetical protein AQUCO_02000193v1 [Aquilegia coerulea]
MLCILQSHLIRASFLSFSTSLNKQNHNLFNLLSFRHFQISFDSRKAYSVMASSSSNDFVKGTIHSNGVAVITLDRPKALNAMNLEMDLKYKSYLDEWETDPKVKCVLVDSSSPRAFSAGGDVKQITTKRQKSDMIEKTIHMFHGWHYNGFWNWPIWSWSLSSYHRENSTCHARKWNWLVSRCWICLPSSKESRRRISWYTFFHSLILGAYLGMTGNRISSPADALYLGAGTHYVPSKDLASVRKDLLALTFSDDPHKEVKELLTRYNKEPESEAQLKLIIPQIVASFGSNKSIVEIIENLEMLQKSPEAAVAEWAKDALIGLGKGAPFSLCLTKEHFSRVASALGKDENDMSKLNGVMKTEYRIAIRSSLRNDFAEGVRAVLVDKDQNPQWNPSRLEDVDLSEVHSLFEPLVADVELDV